MLRPNGTRVARGQNTVRRVQPPCATMTSMCGRIDQSQTARYYASVMGWLDAVYDSESEPAYNVPPGTYRPVLHLQDGERRVDDV